MLSARVRPGSIWGLVVVLIAIMAVFAVIRVTTDAGNLTSGTIPHRSEFDYRYALYPWLAYAHIVPGVVYLALAPFQLWRGFRSRYLAWHRRIGRVAIVAGLLAGLFGVVFGILMPFGGALQASATVAFGAYFVLALALAYRFIRRRDVRRHRRWMIRAFAVGLAVGTIRIWVGLFESFGLLSFRDAFGVAFWLAFTMHVVAAELWLRWRPSVSGASTAGPRPSAAAGTGTG